jgi:ferredoxin
MGRRVRLPRLRRARNSSSSESRGRSFFSPNRCHAAAGSVVTIVNALRTQNGHIRNDTRDISRRIPPAANRTLCRRKCVACDRACTRVTPRNLHGKEEVTAARQAVLPERPPARLHTYYTGSAWR